MIKPVFISFLSVYFFIIFVLTLKFLKSPLNISDMHRTDFFWLNGEPNIKCEMKMLKNFYFALNERQSIKVEENEMMPEGKNYWTS